GRRARAVHAPDKSRGPRRLGGERAVSGARRAARALARTAALLAAAGALLAPASSVGAPPRAGLAPLAQSCPVAPDPAALPSAAKLREMNSYVAGLGVRPTGYRSQNLYIKWILSQLKTVPGALLSEERFTINRWKSSSAELQLKVGETTTAVAIAAPVPYAQATRSGGVSAPLVEIPDEEPITVANAAGRSVVRPAP